MYGTYIVGAIILERYRRKVTIFAAVYLRAQATFRNVVFERLSRNDVISRQQRYQLILSNIASASGAQSCTIFRSISFAVFRLPEGDGAEKGYFT